MGDDASRWEKTEEKFARLVRLGGDERTPEHERNAACRAAVRMFTKGEMTITSTGRWDALVLRIRRLISTVTELQESLPPNGPACRFPFNLNGKNGWQCCQCGSFNTSLVELWLGSLFSGQRCTMCGHQRCGRPKPDVAWNSPAYASRRSSRW